MKQLTLTDEQMSVLREVLENALTELQMQEAHTDTRDYRTLLKHRQEILDKILNGVVSEEPAMSI